MCNIFLEIKAKELVNTLILVRVLEKYVAIARYTLDVQASLRFLALICLSEGLDGLLLSLFGHIQDHNFVWAHAGVYVHFIINE